MNKNKPIPKSQVRKTPHGWQVYAAGPKGHIAQGQPHKDLGAAKRDAKKFEETEMDEGPPSQKFKPLKHKVWSADASIPAGARPKDPGKPAKYKVSKKTGMGFGQPTNEELPVGHRTPSPGADSTASYARLQDAKRKAKAAGKDYDRLPWGHQQKYHEDVKKTKAEKKKAAKGGGNADDDDEDGQDDLDKDDEEEATRSKKKPTAEDITVDERVAAMDLSDDVRALTGGEGLSEEFKTKAATIFEAAVKAKIRSELERLEEEYAEAFEQSMSEAKDELSEKVDNYLNYVVEEWIKKNEVALEHQLKSEIAESFISDLRGLFEKHDITVPDDQFDLLDAAAERADEMEDKLNEEMAKNIDMTQKVNELEQHEILLDVASDLADTEVEKFSELAETVEYESATDYRIKLETIKDSYFPKVPITEDVEAAPTEEDYEVDSDQMAAYMNAIGKTERRASQN